MGILEFSDIQEQIPLSIPAIKSTLKIEVLIFSLLLGFNWENNAF
jgi:hypothetical protein